MIVELTIEIQVQTHNGNDGFGKGIERIIADR